MQGQKDGAEDGRNCRNPGSSVVNDAETKDSSRSTAAKRFGQRTPSVLARRY
jgi:hypothetical protein